MATMLILADSNFMRYKDAVMGREATCAAATRAASLVDVKRFLSTPDLNHYVIASVNMLVDEVLIMEDSIEEKQRKARIRIDELFAFADRTATEKAVKIVIVPPLPIQNPPKYAQISGQVLGFFQEAYAAQEHSFDVTKEFAQPILGPDKIHLTAESGKGYAQHVLTETCRIFGFVTGMEVDRQNWADEAQPIDVKFLDEVTDEAIKAAIRHVYQSHVQLRREVEDRWASDDKAWCLAEEARDAVANEAKMDSLILIGTSYTYNGNENVAAMYQACTDLIATVVDPLQCPQVGGNGMVQILKAVHLNKSPGARPILEIKMDSKMTAAMVRRCFLTKVRETPMPGITIAPAVTTGTRVRVEILKALARRLKAAGQDAFCVQHVARPILAVIDSGFRTNYSYIEAVTRFGGMIGPADKEPAYKRLLGSYPGRAKSVFLILDETGRNPHQPTTKKRSFRVSTAPGQPRGPRPRLAAPNSGAQHLGVFWPQNQNLRPNIASTAPAPTPYQWRVPPPAAVQPTVPMPVSLQLGQPQNTPGQHNAPMNFAQAAAAGSIATQQASGNVVPFQPASQQQGFYQQGPS
jgi:hypothetical protein